MKPDLWIDNLDGCTHAGAEVSTRFFDTFADSRKVLVTVARANATAGLRVWLHLGSRVLPIGEFWLNTTVVGHDAQYALRRLAAEMAAADDRPLASPTFLCISRESREEWKIALAGFALAREMRSESGECGIQIFQSEKAALRFLGEMDFYELPEPGQQAKAESK